MKRAKRTARPHDKAFLRTSIHKNEKKVTNQSTDFLVTFAM